MSHNKIERYCSLEFQDLRDLLEEPSFLGAATPSASSLEEPAKNRRVFNDMPMEPRNSLERFDALPNDTDQFDDENTAADMDPTEGLDFNFLTNVDLSDVAQTHILKQMSGLSMGSNVSSSSEAGEDPLSEGTGKGKRILKQTSNISVGSNWSNCSEGLEVWNLAYSSSKGSDGTGSDGTGSDGYPTFNARPLASGPSDVDERTATDISGSSMTASWSYGHQPRFAASQRGPTPQIPRQHTLSSSGLPRPPAYPPRATGVPIVNESLMQYNAPKDYGVMPATASSASIPLYQQQQQIQQHLFSAALAIPPRSTPERSNSFKRSRSSPLAQSNPSQRAKGATKRAARRVWTEEEDQRLRDAVKQVGGAVNWRQIGTLVGTRNANKCAQRWRKSLRPELANVVKGTWTEDEDIQLRGHVGQHGSKGVGVWENIAVGMSWRRNPKQCRERWQNFLDPTLKIGNWSSEEDIRLMQLYKLYGPAWSKISAGLPGRTNDRVKRRHKMLVRY